MRNCQTAFQRVCTIFCSHQQCMQVPVFIHAHQHLLLSVFLIIVFQSGCIFLVKFYLPVVLICICLMNNDVEALILSFECLWWNVYSDLLSIFFIGLFVFLLSCKSSLYTLDANPYQVLDLQIFLLVFSFSLCYWSAKFWVLMRSNLSNF